MDSKTETPPKTSDNAPPPELSEQLRRIDSKFQTLQSLTRSNRRQALLMAALFFTIAVILIWEILLPIREIHQDPHQFMKSVESEVSSFFPILKFEFNSLAEKLVPAYKNALQKEWDTRLPTLEHVILSEFSLFGNDLQVYLTTQGEVRLNHFVGKWRKRMLKDFPDLEKDVAKLIKIEDSLQNAFHSVVGLHFQKHFDVLVDIKDSLDNLQPPPAIKNLAYAQLQENILELLSKVSNDNFKPLIEMWHKLSSKVTGFIEQFLEVSDLLESKTIKLQQAEGPLAPAKAK